MNRRLLSVLSITGSDSTGQVGIGADIQTISAMGARALVAITSVTTPKHDEAFDAYDLPVELVSEQIKLAMHDCSPKAVKVGMVRDLQTISMLPSVLVNIPHRVMVPSIFDSVGRRILSSQALDTWMEHLLPLSSLLILRVCEAEFMLGRNISTDKDMLQAADDLVKLGARSVMLRSANIGDGHLTALLLHEGGHQFFTSRNTAGWQMHGVSGALSSAIATRFAFGDSVEQAVSNAHSFIHSRVVYAVSPSYGVAALRPSDIYNNFLSLLAGHYTVAHDVAFYASRLCISTRYLHRVTDKVVGRSPKQIISDYLMHEACSMLQGTRLTIQEVSQHLGFSSQSQFSRFFANEHGVSPQAYRLGIYND